MSKQGWTAGVAAAVFIVCTALIAFIPIPYVSWLPGDSVDVLGTRDGESVIKVEGASTYPTEGQLRMTTVSMTSAEAQLNLMQAMAAWLRPKGDVIPRSLVYPAGQSDQQIQQLGTEQMASSQEDATVAALRAAGAPVVPVVRVARVASAGPSSGKLAVDDIVKKINGKDVSRRAQVQELIQRANPGDVFELEIERSGVTTIERVTSAAALDDPHLPKLGIDLIDDDLHEIKVNYSVGSSIGGPSAGLIFALGVYDELTPESLADGRIIAGTGAVKASGEVGAVGGARQKLASAESGNATVFLLPAANCPDIEGIKTSMTVVKVTKLEDAISSLDQLKNPESAGQVPRC